MTTLLAVLAGGVGAGARYGVGLAAQQRWPERPLGTAIVNVVGATGLGALLGSDPSTSVALVVGTGFLGGFTTFSTWMVETWALHGDRTAHRVEPVVNVVVVLLAGWVGYVAAGWVV